MATNIKVNVEEIGHILDDLRACNELLTSASKNGLEGTKKANKHCSIGYDTPIIMDHIDKELSMTIGGGILTLQTVLFKYVTTDGANKGKVDGIKGVDGLKASNGKKAPSGSTSNSSTNSSDYNSNIHNSNNNSSDYNDYLQKQAKMADVKGLKQMYGHSPKPELHSTKQKGDHGECTTVVQAVLLNRRMKLDDVNASQWSVQDVWNAKGNGASVPQLKDGTPKPFTCTDGTQYTYSTTIDFPNSIDGYTKLLDEHPEGIVLYEDYRYRYVTKGKFLYNEKGEVSLESHAIVISRYEKTDNGIQLYVFDGSAKDYTNEIKIEDSSLLKRSEYRKTVDDLLYGERKQNYYIGYLK